jgi:hypothetical protein
MPHDPQLKPPSRILIGLRRTRDVLVTLGIWIILCVSVFGIIKSTTEQHWALGIVATAFYSWGVYLGIADLRSREARRFPVHKGLFIFLLAVLTGIAVAASVSLQLRRVGWAIYEPVSTDDDAYFSLVGYYVWVFLDMLPAIKAAELLAFAAPLKPQNSVAGIPVVLFRVFVLFGLLAALKVWWQGRKEVATVPGTPVQTDGEA